MMLDQVDSLEFEGKVVIITGAARGIGKTTALEFSKKGATVVIVDILEQELKEVSEIIQKMDKKVLPLKADVSDNSQVQDVIKRTIDNFAKIDVLVNNAAIGGELMPAVNLTEEIWDRILRINLKSVFLFCKGVVPFMIENKKGSIVNVGSLAGKNGNEKMSAYSVSKAGVHIFSRVLAKEVVREGIRVNSIAPGLIHTDMTSTSELPKDIADALLSNNPMGRKGYPEEVANLILFLSSEKASYITGQCINVSGGKGDY
jgi:3-oxoacyl-[acyl-carrier protein] reductase